MPNIKKTVYVVEQFSYYKRKLSPENRKENFGHYRILIPRELVEPIYYLYRDKTACIARAGECIVIAPDGEILMKAVRAINKELGYTQPLL